MAITIDPIQILNQQLLKAARRIVRKINDELQNLLQSTQDNQSIWGELKRTHGRHSRRVEAFKAAFNKSISELDSVRNTCDQISDAENGFAAISIALQLQSYFKDLKKNINKINQLYILTDKDLFKNSKITPSRRSYNDKTYDIINLT